MEGWKGGVDIATRGLGSDNNRPDLCGASFDQALVCITVMLKYCPRRVRLFSW